MGYIVRMPKLGLEMETGTVLEWHVGEDDLVEEGAVLAEIESEKTTAEVDAREGGTLRRIFLEEGASVSPGTPMGIVAGANESIEDLVGEAQDDLEDTEATVESASAGAETEAETATAAGTTVSASGAASEEDEASEEHAAKASPRAKKRADELGVTLAEVEGTGPRGSITADDVEAAAEASSDEERREVRASPRAKKRADDLGVDLESVSGTGPQGSITADDVESAAESESATAASAAKSETATGTESSGATRTLAEERAFDGMRQTIAKRLSQSYREAVHVTEHREVDAEELLAAADAADAALDTDISMTDVLLVALSDALSEHPAFNATFEDDAHRLYEEHNICMAVDVDEGLVTPVVPDVGSKSLAALASDRRDITTRTLDGDYTMTDLQGGTFTVTNLGVLGVESFDPIINPPQIAILGVNTLLERVELREDGTPESRRVLPLDLSFDHRVVDGADAARFLGTLADTLEDPWSLLPDEVAAERPTGESVAAPARQATATSTDGMTGTVRTRGVEQQYAADEANPEPVDLFLGSLAACLSLSIRYQADMRDAAVSAIDVTADAAPASGSVESIDITVTLAAPEVADDTLDRVVEYGERSCHVAELLREDLPVDLQWKRQ